MYRVWPGTIELCLTQLDQDYSKVSTNLRSGSSRVDRTAETLYKDDYIRVEEYTRSCKAERIDSIAQINMTRLDGAIICGKRADYTYLDLVMVDLREQVCPDQLLPCLGLSMYEVSTISACVDDLSQCPIIDLKVIDEDEHKSEEP